MYLGEAGDTNFDESGTRRLLYTALALAGEGFPLHRALLECRYETIAANGRFSNSHENNDYFHTTEDSLETRARATTGSASCSTTYPSRVNSSVNCLAHTMRPRGRVRRRRTEIRGAIKKAVSAALAGSGVTYAIMPMASKSDLCLQAVDYYSWAMYRKWESGDAAQAARLGGNVVEIPYVFAG